MEMERKRRREDQQVESSGENSTAMGDGGGKRTTDLTMEPTTTEYGREVSMEIEVLECPLCHLPLKPPIFQCCEGHCICSSCRDELSAAAGGKCPSCSAALSPTRCLPMERVVESVRVPCTYAGHGCTKTMSYLDGDKKEAHERACPHAPFSCPDSGCGFAGAPAALLDHFASRHKSSEICSGTRVQPGLQLLRGHGGRLFLVKALEEVERKTREQEEGEARSRSSGERKRRNVLVEPVVLSCGYDYEGLSAPIFQCGECHFALCSSCGERPANKCQSCDTKLPLRRCFALERVLESVVVPRCRHAVRGCAETMLPFAKMEDHEADCSYGPVYCPDPSCSVSGRRFVGAVAALRDHFAGHHKWPSTEFRYGESFELPVQPGYHALSAQDDGRLFLVSMAPGTSFGYAVAIVCVRRDSSLCFDCSVCFSCSEPGRHRRVLSEDMVGTSELRRPPTDYSFVVPWKSYEGGAAGVLGTTIQLPREG